MNPNWRSFLESAEAVFKDGGDEILNFGDASGELQAARNQTVLVPLTHLGLIEATRRRCQGLPAQPVHQRHQSSGRRPGPAFRLVHGQGAHAGQFPRLARGGCLPAGHFGRPGSGLTEAPADVRAALQGQAGKPDRESSVARGGRPAGRRGAWRCRPALPGRRDDQRPRRRGQRARTGSEPLCRCRQAGGDCRPVAASLRSRRVRPDCLPGAGSMCRPASRW